MRQNTLRLISLARRAETLKSAQVLSVGEAGISRASTGGKFGEDGWVRSGGVMPLSCEVSVGVVFLPTSSIVLSS